MKKVDIIAIILFLISLLVLPIVHADTIPYTDWNYKCAYNLKNVSNLTVCNDAKIGRNLNVTGNISANYFFGSGALLKDLNVTGNFSFNGIMYTNLNMNGYNITNANYIFSNYFLGGFFYGIYNWIVGPTSTNYLSFNGTQLDFNETNLNLTIDYKVLEANTSMANYVDAKDILFNNSMTGYVDTKFVNKAGDTMTGNLNMSGNNITNVGYIEFNNNITTHKIYDNSTCLILTGDTSTLYIC